MVAKENERMSGRPTSRGQSPHPWRLFLPSIALAIFLLLHGIALAGGSATDGTPQVNLGVVPPLTGLSPANPVDLGFATNPRASSSFLGNGLLGRTMGFGPNSGVSIGGILIGSGNWLVSGGVEPGSTSGTAALGLNMNIDTEKAFGLPGGQFAAEFGAWIGQNVNGDAGSVQNYSTISTQAPFNRDELLQLWWRQKLFDGKLIIKAGKINATGDFGVVLSPVPVNQPYLQDWTISGLLYVPPGLNPTLFGRLPGYPNTAYGLEVTLEPTKQIYASYGIFDGNGATGFQTGLYAGPHINTYKFNIGEIGGDWRLGPQGKPGLAGIGVWGQTGRLLTPYLTYENGATGFYAFANQRLWYQHPGKDTSGIIGFLQYGYTNDRAAEVNAYAGGGLTAVGLMPRRPADSMGIGLAWSRLNRGPFAGAFFFPGISSTSTALRKSELMMQVYYQAVLIPWTLVLEPAYTFIPTPGARPNLPAAHALTAELVALF
jgi:porin